MLPEPINTAIAENSPLHDALTTYEPAKILKKAEKEHALINENNYKLDPESALFKALTLNEFSNGMLLTIAVPEYYRTFGIDMCRRLQEEYHCITVSRKATCELATINYIRTLETQRKLNLLLEGGGKSKMDLLYISILSKELDRANRHYLTAIQTLQFGTQPSLQVNIHTKNANFGQHQNIQTNTLEEKQ